MHTLILHFRELRHNWIRHTLFLVLPLIAAISSHGTHLHHFNPVPHPEAYPRGVEISTRYKVLVKPAGDPAEWDAERHLTTTYRLWPDYVDPETLPKKHSQTAVHVAQVDTDGRVRVRVELIDGDAIRTLRLKPTRLAEMEATRESGPDWVEFEVDPYRFTRSVLVEINAPERDADALQDGLMFFLNPLSRKPAGNILELPSGVVGTSLPQMDELNCIRIGPDSEYDGLYLPADTILDGRIEVRKPGFKVMGRGMIIGSRWPFAKSHPNWREGYPEWISPDGTRVRPLLAYMHPRDTPEDRSTTFEGVLVAHPYHFCVGYAFWNENLKTFGWRYSSDGIHGEHKRGSFMRVNDDATYANDGSVEDCVYWGMVNGACFQLGWGLRGDNNHPVTVRRIDVLRGEWDDLPNPGPDSIGIPKDIPTQLDKNGATNRGVIAGTFRSAGAFTVRNKHFEDIRVDAQVNRLFYLGSKTLEVSYENFSFKDIWFEKEPAYEPGVINVLSGKRTINNFVFENFRIGEKKVMSLEDLEPLDQRNVERVEFR